MKKALKIFGVLCAVLLCAATLFGVYIWRHPFTIPNFLKNKASDFTLSNYGIAFDFDKFSIDIPSNEILVASLSLGLDPEKPMITFDNATIKIASDSYINGTLNQNNIVDRVVVNNLVYDMMAPNISDASASFKLPSIPVHEIALHGLDINTPYGRFDLSSDSVYLRKLDDIASVKVVLPEGPYGIKAFLDSVIDLKKGVASFSVQLGHQNFGDCLPMSLFASEKDVYLDKGQLSVKLNYHGNIEDRINAPLDNLEQLFNDELSGSVVLRDINVSWNSIPFEGSIFVERIASNPWTYSIEGKLLGSDIKVSGEWLGNSESLLNFATDFYLEDLRLDKQTLERCGLVNDDYTPGSLGITGKITTNKGKVSGKGRITGTDWYFRDKKVEDAKLRWILNEDLCLKFQGIMRTHIGSLNASSTVWLAGDKKNQGIFEGAIHDIHLKDIGEIVDVPLDGKCSGPFIVNFSLDDLSKFVLNLDLTMNEGKFYTFNTKTVRADVTLTGDMWKINNPKVDLHNGGTIIGEGYVSNKGLNVKVKSNNLDLYAFGLDRKTASGSINFEGVASGSLDVPRVKGNLWSNNLTIMEMPVNTVKSEVYVHDDILAMAPFVIRPIDGSIVDGYFSLNLIDSKIECVRVNFQQLCLDLFKPYFSEDIKSKEIDGVFAGYVNYSRLTGENVWNVLVDGRNISIAGEDIESVYLEAGTWDKQAELRGLTIKGFGGKLNVTGQFIELDKFTGNIEADDIDFSKMNVLRNILPDVQGKLDILGDIDWNGKHRNGSLNVFAKNLEVGGRELGNYSGSVIINDEKLAITQSGFDKLGIKLVGDLMWSGRQPYHAELDFNDVDFAFIAKAHGFNAFDNGCILADGKCVVDGELASETPDFLDFKLDSLRIEKDNEVIVANKPVQLLYQNGNAELRSLELKYKLGILKIEGLISSDKKVAVLIDGDSFSAKALGRLFGSKGLDYDGDLHILSRIYGTLDDIKYNTEAELSNFVIEKREIPLISTKISGNSSELNLEDFLIQLKNSKINAHGLVKMKNFEPKGFGLGVNVPDVPLTDLQVYFPDAVKEAIGTFSAKLKIGGSVKHPHIIGDMFLNAKRLQLSAVKKTFTDIEFAMSTKDLLINFDKIKANLGKGTISGFGNVDFSNEIGDMDIHLLAEKIDLPLNNLEINNASASLDLTGNTKNPVIIGKAYVPKGKLMFSTDLFSSSTPSKPPFDSLKYNFDLDIPRNFWLKSGFMNAELKGDIRLSGDLDNFKLEGGISTIQGKIFFKQRQFKIENGEIRFGGVDNSIDPYIFVKSEGQIQSTKIFLTLQGNLSNFKPKVYSTPPMSEGDIIAMLTLGRDLNSAMKSDTKELFEDEVLDGLKNSYLSSIIGGTISQALNLDELYLSSMYDKTSGKSQQYIRVGKYISERVFMAYEGTMEDDKKESYIFEYRMPKGIVFSLEFQQPENNQEFGVRYDFHF